MNQAAWPAPAKLNLFLHVIGRREDGYHLLQTVFQLLDVSDYLSFDLRDDGQILRPSGPDDLPADQDLTVRAARLLQTQAGTHFGADIFVDKRLPMGAGLGGGSSDAATALIALNRLWGLGMSLDTLAAIGLRLGADVPIFMRGHTAWGEGIGELLEPVTVAEAWYLIIQPPVQVSTAAVFNDPELTRSTPPITIRDFLSGGGHNDCEPVVRKRYPQVAEALDWLGSHGEARLTGTGACVFSRFNSEQAARAVLAQLPEDWQGLVAKGINRSPLLAMMDTNV